MIAIGSMLGMHALGSYSVAIGSSTGIIRTPLYHAVINKHADATRLLLECGANAMANHTLRDILDKVSDVGMVECFYIVKHPYDALRMLVDHIGCSDDVQVIHHSSKRLIIVI